MNFLDHSLNTIQKIFTGPSTHFLASGSTLLAQYNSHYALVLYLLKWALLRWIPVCGNSSSSLVFPQVFTFTSEIVGEPATKGFTLLPCYLSSFFVIEGSQEQMGENHPISSDFNADSDICFWTEVGSQMAIYVKRIKHQKKKDAPYLLLLPASLRVRRW